MPTIPFLRYQVWSTCLLASFITILVSPACVCSQDGLSEAQKTATDSEEAGQTTSIKPVQELPLYPLDICEGQDQMLFIVDRNLPGVWQRKSETLSLMYQGSKRFRTPLNAPRCLAIDPQGNLLVGDSATRDLYRFDAQGTPQALTEGGIGIPMDLAFKSDGTLYVADLELRMLLRIPADSRQVERVAEINPRGLFVDSKDQLWVVTQNDQQLLIVADDGQQQVIVKERVFEFPHQVVVNSAGEAFVSDGYKKGIWKVIPGTAPQLLFSGPPLMNPVGLALIDDGVVVVDPAAKAVFRLDGEGNLEKWFDVVR